MSSALTRPDSAQAAEEPKLTAWTRRTDWPLTGLATVFLIAFAWQVLDTAQSPTTHAVLEAVMWSIWGVFTVDYLTRLALARHRARFVYRNLLDLLAVALPMVRQLRVLRVLTVLNVLNRRAQLSVRGRLGVYVVGMIILIGGCAALAVLDTERGNPNANIRSFPDAVWWTLTTITTVGYGDRYPVTVEGRLVAGALMIGGIALLGVVTGVVASWFVDTIKGAEQTLEQATAREVAELHAEIAELRTLLAQSRPAAPAQPSAADSR